MKIQNIPASITYIFVPILVMLFLASSLVDAAEQKEITLPTSQGDIQSQLRIQNSSVDNRAYRDLTEEMSGVISEVSPQVSQLAAPPPLEADLSISKSASPDPVSVGQILEYSITVSNAGPDRAQKVVVTDTLPAEVSFVSANFECTLPGDLGCNLSNIKAGESKTLIIAVTVNSEGNGTINNTARVSSEAIESSPGDEEVTISTSVTRSADLSISKSANPDPVSVGQLLTYMVTVDNNGPGAATGVVVTDTLPSEVSFSSASAGCNNAGAIVCSLGTIPAGSNKSIEIVVTVNSEGSGTIANSAVVSSDTPETNPGDESTTITTNTTTAQETADLSISKLANPDPVSVGDLLTYEITVDNKGPAVATNVVVVDNLAAGLTFLSASPGCNNPGDVECSLGSIAINSSETITIAVNVDSIVSGAIENTAFVTSDTAEANPGDESTTISTGTSEQADLAISKSDSHDPAFVGEVLTYTTAVENLGPSEATDVVITDALPTEVSFISASAGCTHPGNVICGLGTLANGESKTVDIVVSVNSSLPGSITNQADVTSSSADSNPANNHAAEVTIINVTGSADLAITKSDSPDPAIAGESLTYSINVENLGPDDATGVVVTDTLPAEVSFVSASAGCVMQDVLTCLLGSLGAGGSKEVTIEVTVDSAAPVVITNRADVFSAAADDNLNNNQTTEETAISNRADLSIVNYVSSGPVIAGRQITYTLVVTNSGPSMARKTVINNSILPDFNFVSSPDCVLSGDSVSCDMGEIDAGGSKQTTIVVGIDPGITGNITAVSTVFSAAQDLFPSNNSSVAVDSVLSVSDLGVTKTASSPTVIPGTSMTYLIEVVNLGPSVASQVEVSDLLPAELTLITSTVSQGAGCDSANPVSCNLGNLLVNQVATVSLVVDVAPSVIDSVENTASVQSLAIDPNTDNNQDTVQTPIGVSANLNIEKQDNHDPVTAGTSLEYTLLVGNAGPSDASSVVATDTLPAGVTFKSVTNNAGGTCGGTSVVICQFDNLSVGAVASIKILVDVDPGQNSSLVNTATVQSAASDPDPDDNTTNETTEVEALVDLMIEISGQPNPVVAGETLTYTLQVTNKGPSLASGVVVTTAIPSDVQLSHSQTSQGTGCSGNSLVICQLGDVDPLSDAYVVLSTAVYTNHDGLIENSAAVSSDQTDLVPGNNDAEKSVIVLDQRFDLYFPITIIGFPTGEPNNNCNQAYRIRANTTYQFFAEDSGDWYVFDLFTNGDLVVELRNFEPVSGQIALYKGQDCSSRDLIQNNGNPGTSKTIDAGQRSAGQYYVFISNDGALNSQDPYELRVSFSP